MNLTVSFSPQQKKLPQSKIISCLRSRFILGGGLGLVLFMAVPGCAKPQTEKAVPAETAAPPDNSVLNDLKSIVAKESIFKAEPYIELATALQALPEKERAAQLTAWAKDPDNDWEIFYLCRLLFAPAPGKSF